MFLGVRAYAAVAAVIIGQTIVVTTVPVDAISGDQIVAAIEWDYSKNGAKRTQRATKQHEKINKNTSHSGRHTEQTGEKNANTANIKTLNKQKNICNFNFQDRKKI